MSAPYLNRGETIILTTHRVSVGNTHYDALLTTERLILMDRQYTRFEPRMIHFPAIVTVKAGKAPSGEPAIILTLNSPSDLTGSELVNILFLQDPGEDRRPEREQWVKKLIGLVISAREQGIQENISEPATKKTGVQPSVRRWVAPEPPHPHTSHEPPTPPAPEPEVIAETPDPMEFFLETPSPGKKEAQKKIVTEPRARGRNKPVIPVAAPPVADPEITREPETVAILEPESIPKAADPVTLPEGEGTLPVSDGMPAADAASGDAFARIVASAAESLHANKEVPPVSLSEVPVPEEVPQPCVAGEGLPSLHTETPPPPPPVAPAEPEIQEPQPAPATVSEPAVSRAKPAPGSLRELPGTYTPTIPVAVTGQSGETPLQEHRPWGTLGKPMVIAGAGVLLILLVIFGGMAALSYLPFAQQSHPSIPTVTPSTTAGPPPATMPSATAPAGVEVRVDYPGKFFGTAGNPGYLHPVSGTGNSTFSILMITSIVQATIQKPDNSGDAMTVGIYNNNMLLTRKTITAPMGEVNILINVTTALPPGLEGTKTDSANQFGSKGSLNDY